jgi:hypothetical protein
MRTTPRWSPAGIQEAGGSAGAKSYPVGTSTPSVCQHGAGRQPKRRLSPTRDDPGASDRRTTRSRCGRHRRRPCRIGRQACPTRLHEERLRVLGRRPLFAVEGINYTWDDVLAWAEARGTLGSLTERSRRGSASLRRAEELGARPSAEAVSAAAAGFRYGRGLLSAEQLSSWLSRWELSVADWGEYLERTSPSSTTSRHRARPRRRPTSSRPPRRSTSTSSARVSWSARPSPSPRIWHSPT